MLSLPPPVPTHLPAVAASPWMFARDVRTISLMMSSLLGDEVGIVDECWEVLFLRRVDYCARKIFFGL